VSNRSWLAQIAKRTGTQRQCSGNLVPILEEIAGWQRPQIRQLFESYGFLIQDGIACRPIGSRLRPIGVVGREGDLLPTLSEDTSESRDSCN